MIGYIYTVFYCRVEENIRRYSIGYFEAGGFLCICSDDINVLLLIPHRM